MIYLGDVDVVRKLAACGFLPMLPDLLGMRVEEIAIRYLPSLKHRLGRPNHRLASPEFQGHLEAFCAMYTPLETVADIDRQEALQVGGMDVGEAILFAEAEATGGTVVTGDKRALLAYRRLSGSEMRCRIRVVCWEQLLLRVCFIHGYETLRKGCCQGFAEDGVLKLAFSSGLATVEEHAMACIRSHLRKVMEHSGDILIEFEGLL